MELLQIITFSVKIFALIAAIIVLASYLIFKLKNRKRKKPYADAPVQSLTIEPTVPNLQFQGQYENAQVENMQYDNMQYEGPQYENVQSQNVQYENQPVMVYQNNQPRSFGQRFKILNEDNNSTIQRKPLIEKLQPAASNPQRYNTTRQAQVFNIYDYYSNNNFEPMHKINS